MTDHRIQIRGGAGPYEAAAIAAVIQRVSDEQIAGRARLPDRNEPTAWVRAGRMVKPGDIGPYLTPGPGLNWPEM